MRSLIAKWTQGLSLGLAPALISTISKDFNSCPIPILYEHIRQLPNFKNLTFPLLKIGLHLSNRQIDLNSDAYTAFTIVYLPENVAIYPRKYQVSFRETILRFLFLGFGKILTKCWNWTHKQQGLRVAILDIHSSSLFVVSRRGLNISSKQICEEGFIFDIF